MFGLHRSFPYLKLEEGRKNDTSLAATAPAKFLLNCFAHLSVKSQVEASMTCRRWNILAIKSLDKRSTEYGGSSKGDPIPHLIELFELIRTLQKTGNFYAVIPASDRSLQSRTDNPDPIQWEEVPESVRSISLHQLVNIVSNRYHRKESLELLTRFLLNQGTPREATSGLSLKTEEQILNSLTDSIVNGLPNQTALLLRFRANPNQRDRRAYTPLATAVKEDNPEMVKILLEGGANPNNVYQNGRRVLNSAARRGQTSIGSLLIEHKADLNAINGKGKSALNAAINKSRKSMTKLLLQAKADTNLTDHNGDTPLLLAVRNERKSYLKLLLQKNANPNTLDTQGTPLLFEAIQRGESEKVSLLLEYRADPKLPDASGKSAYSHAKEVGDAAILESLKSALKRRRKK